jgi:hypothetical protein
MDQVIHLQLVLLKVVMELEIHQVVLLVAEVVLEQMVVELQIM